MQTGNNVVILKIFWPKILASKWSFYAKNTANSCKK
jgi:hypothetical protein